MLQNFQPRARCTRRYRHQRRSHFSPEGGSRAASGTMAMIYSRNTSRILGTQTSTEIRRECNWRTISLGLWPRMNITSPASMGGMKVAIAWPKRWLRGRRFKKRIGRKGRAYFRYFKSSRSTGTMLARIFRCAIITPFGSAVAPEVKMISASVSRVTFAAGLSVPSADTRSESGRTGMASSGGVASAPSSASRARVIAAMRDSSAGDAR